uniref:SPARC-like 1 n=1 Tax=Amphiprion percula TaxID=161767 RepID=A0A3P8TFB0_AMPPE
MRACLVFLCLLAATLALSVSSKVIIFLSMTSEICHQCDVITEEANKPQILPTLVTFAAISQEQEDEELSSEDNANSNKEDEEVTEKREKSTPVLLSEEELVDLLRKEEEEVEADKGQKKKVDNVEEDVKEESGKDEAEEEVEKMSLEEKQEESAGRMADTEEQAALLEEADGSTESEIPVDLDYAADSGLLQPLHIVPAEVKAHTETQVNSKKAVKEKEELPSIADDYEQEMQNTEAADSEEVSDQEKVPQEAKGSAELESRSRLSEKEEEKSKNESGSHSKRKTRKQKKNQRAKKHSPQRDETQAGKEQSQQDAQESDGSNIDNTVHKAKRRRAGKWGPLVGMNPVQIRATADLYPRSRPSADEDPCDNFRCKRGKMCKLDADNKPGCVCQEPSQCPPSMNEFDHVCGTDNKTYDTSCELFATKCNLEGSKRGHRLHLDYTGACKLIPACVDTELIQFPLRMRDWLKNVLLQLYEHDSVSHGFLTPKQRFRVKKIFESERRLHAGDHSVELLAQDFEKNYNMYIYPVHWQFAQLDQHPSDRFLSHSELAPLRVPLVPMEHCTSRFFQECDADKDKQVSFKEWTSCFGIKNEDMDVNLLF